MTPTILDLCSGGGLAADGYAAVGLEPYGVDIATQDHYPYAGTEGDVLDWLESRRPAAFDAIHVSPPCQLFTTAKHLRKAQGGQSKETIDYLTPTLAILRGRWGQTPWIVENVDDNTKQARTIMAPRPGETLVMLCGSMFGLEVQRHRLFLANFPLRQPACQHHRFPADPVTGKPRPWGVYHVKGDAIPSGGRTARDEEHGRHVMGSRRLLPWDTLKEGFPPAYTSHVGADLLVELSRR